jgi:hypothetical protein
MRSGERCPPLLKAYLAVRSLRKILDCRHPPKDCKIKFVLRNPPFAPNALAPISPVMVTVTSMMEQIFNDTYVGTVAAGSATFYLDKA